MRIEWASNAVTDLENIKDYISNDSNYYAGNFVRGMINAVERLRDFPKSGRVVPEICDDNIREVIYGNYRIVYQIADKKIIVVTVVHAMREFKGL